MTRFPPIPPEKMTPRQREVVEAIQAGPRGGVRGPFNAWLRSPELADRGQRLGELLRFKTSLPPRLSELAIIITARQWTAQYEWYAHERLAREAGLDTAIIAAVAERRRPEFKNDDEATVHDFCTELYATRGVSDATFARAVAAFGEQGVVEIIGLCGYYVMVAMTLNVAQVELPAGVPTPLRD